MFTLKDPKHLEDMPPFILVNCLMLLKLQIQHNPGFMFELPKHSY